MAPAALTGSPQALRDQCFPKHPEECSVLRPLGRGDSGTGSSLAALSGVSHTWLLSWLPTWLPHLDPHPAPIPGSSPGSPANPHSQGKPEEASQGASLRAAHFLPQVHVWQSGRQGSGPHVPGTGAQARRQARSWLGRSCCTDSFGGNTSVSLLWRTWL